jgi:hypothetical protein
MSEDQEMIDLAVRSAREEERRKAEIRNNAEVETKA